MPGLGDPFGPYPPGGPSPRNDADGQCQLTLSNSALLLSRADGRFLWIGNEAREIPAAGLALPVTGLSNSTLYYIYAKWNGAMALEASTVAYETDGVMGHKVKIKDSTRRLVGMAYVTSGGAFADSPTQRFVRSYFKDPGYTLQNTFAADRSTSSSTFAEINSEIRVSFIMWAGETVRLSCDGEISIATLHTISISSIALDGATPDACGCGSQAYNANARSPLAMTLEKAGLSEGFHYATLVGNSSSGSVTYNGSSAGERIYLRGFMRR